MDGEMRVIMFCLGIACGLFGFWIAGAISRLCDRIEWIDKKMKEEKCRY